MATTATIMDAIVTTMAMANEGPADGGEGASRRERAPKPSYLGAALIGAVVAVLLLVLGVPRLVAALVALGPQGVVWDVHSDVPVPVAGLAAAADGLASAGRWVINGGDMADRGLLLSRQAAAVPPGPQRVRLLEEAEAATVSGLAVAPGQPGVWFRLAWLREIRGDRAGALAALRVSWLSGGFVPSVMLSRLEFAFGLVPSMNAEMRSLLRRQLRLTWVVAPEAVDGFSRRPDVAPLVQEALADLSDADVARYVRLHGRAR